MLFVGKCYGWKQGYSCFLKTIDYYCWRKEILWPVGCSSGENSQGKTPYRNHFQSKNLIKRWDNGNTWNLWSAGHSAFSGFPWIFSNGCPTKASTFKYFFELIEAANPLANLFCSGRDIKQRSGSLQHAARFPVMLWGDAAEKAAGLSGQKRNSLCLRTAKICIQKAITWVAFRQNLECKRILQFFNKTGEEWCHGRGFPEVRCLWMINT